MKQKGHDDEVNKLINKTGQYQKQVNSKNRRYQEKPVQNISQKQFGKQKLRGIRF